MVGGEDGAPSDPWRKNISALRFQSAAARAMAMLGMHAQTGDGSGWWWLWWWWRLWWWFGVCRGGGEEETWAPD